jgi:mono/diheme cytochrome c family protein
MFAGAHRRRFKTPTNYCQSKSVSRAINAAPRLLMNTKFWNGLRLSTCLVGLALLVGCGQSAPPPFRLNMVDIARTQIPEAQQQVIANVLTAMYGTPDEPFVLPETGLDADKIAIAAGPVRSDQFGKEGGLYRRHCAHCHGTTGGGMGPTALILNPYPRDYRQGKFKFKATERAAKPTDLDLESVVRNGVQGTAMPSFGLLPDAQIQVLVEYVKYLSIRGQTEISLINALADLSEGDELDTSRDMLIAEILDPIVQSWNTAPEAVINPDPKPEITLAQSIDQGRELFYGTKANCVKCHGPGSLGDGQTTDYDDWNKPLVEMAEGVRREQQSLATDTEMDPQQRSETQTRLAFDNLVLKTDALPPRRAIPRNLRLNIYRGGRRPVDVYRRLYAGINGAPMPGVGPATPGATGTLTSDEIWSVVDYVMSLPYETATDHSPEQQLRVSQAKY